MVSSDGAGGIAARGQIYMDAPISVEIHLQLEIATSIKVPPGTDAPSPLHFAPPLVVSSVDHDIPESVFSWSSNNIMLIRLSTQLLKDGVGVIFRPNVLINPPDF